MYIDKIYFKEKIKRRKKLDSNFEIVDIFSFEWVEMVEMVEMAEMRFAQVSNGSNDLAFFEKFQKI